MASPIPTATRAAQTDWLVRSGLGHDAGQVDDWGRIETLARDEGEVLVYADSARAITAAELFSADKPGIEAEVAALAPLEIQHMLLCRNEDDPLPDVYLSGDPVRTAQLLSEERLWRYVPSTLVNAISETLRSPLLIHHWSALVLVYNSVLSKEPPINSWWDLTRPEWRGMVALPDPIMDERMLYLFTALGQHAEELILAYRAEFGRELALDPDCADAGQQWIKALLANQPVLLASDAEVARLIGDPKADKIRIGICGSEQYAKVARGELALSLVLGAAPAAGLRWPAYLAIVDRCTHPNAAKVFVSWLMGDAAAKRGYAPWYEPGIYPSRSDLPDPQGALPRKEMERALWDIDTGYAAAHLAAVRDHVAAHIGRPVGGR